MVISDVIIGILATGVRLLAPFLFASLGEMFCQRSGVFNLGVEGGIMMMGAFAGFLSHYGWGGTPILVWLWLSSQELPWVY